MHHGSVLVATVLLLSELHDLLLIQLILISRRVLQLLLLFAGCLASVFLLVHLLLLALDLLVVVSIRLAVTFFPLRFFLSAGLLLPF